MPGREAWAKEMELAQKALALDPNLAEAHLSMGTALFSVLGPHASEKELDRAVELNPNLALAYDQYGWTFCGNGPVRRRDRGRKEGAGTRSAKHFSEYGPRLFSLLGAPLRGGDYANPQDFGIGSEQRFRPLDPGLVLDLEREQG